MDHAEFARRMAETDQLVAQTRQRVEETLMQPHPSWPQRFLDALVPSDRALLLFLLVAVFGAGVALGLTIATTREGDRATRELTRQVHESQTSSPLPTLSQRLDAIDQRLQAIETRLSP